SISILVGARGFEPPTSWSQTRRATNCATPREHLDTRPPGRLHADSHAGARSLRRRRMSAKPRPMPTKASGGVGSLSPPMAPPQPFGTVQQFVPVGHIVTVGVQPQTLAMPPPPHVCGAVHAGPHETVPPQPSGMVPQLSGDGHVVSFTHMPTESCALAACTAD